MAETETFAIDRQVFWHNIINGSALGMIVAACLLPPRDTFDWVLGATALAVLLAESACLLSYWYNPVVCRVTEGTVDVRRGWGGPTDVPLEAIVDVDRGWFFVTLRLRGDNSPVHISTGHLMSRQITELVERLADPGD